MAPTRDSISTDTRMRETVLGLTRARLVRENEHLRTGLTEARDVLKELRAHLGRLEEENTLLRSPELHEARFVELDAGYSKVVFRGGSRLVRTASNENMEDLKPGQVVYLSKDLNVIVAISNSASPALGEIAVVERVVAEGHLVVQSRGEEMLVQAAHKVDSTIAKPGDEVVIDRDMRMALELVEKTDTPSWNMEEIADTPPEALGGYDSVRDRVIKRFTLAITNPELARAYGVTSSPKLMFEGPPGTGKTLAMRVVATVVTRLTGKTCRVVSIKASALEDVYVGATQKKIKQLFRDLRTGDGPRLLFIDEVEAIARRRGHAVGVHSDKFLSSWLAEIEGMGGDADVAIIATTNRRDLLDQAFAERFDFTVRMERPRMDAAAEIFAIHLDESFPFASGGVDAAVTRQEVIDAGVAMFFAPNAGNELAVLRFRDGKPRTVSARELISGRLIQQCCAAARDLAFERAAEGGKPGVRVSDLEEAIAEKIGQLATVLTVNNVHHYLTDLPTDIDVVSVEPGQGQRNTRRYVMGERS